MPQMNEYDESRLSDYQTHQTDPVPAITEKFHPTAVAGKKADPMAWKRSKNHKYTKKMEAQQARKKIMPTKAGGSR